MTFSRQEPIKKVRFSTSPTAMLKDITTTGGFSFSPFPNLFEKAIASIIKNGGYDSLEAATS